MAGMTTLADLDAATSVAFDTAAVATAEQAARLRAAQAYCERVLAAPESWELCLGALPATSCSSTRFFCLQVGGVWG